MNATASTLDNVKTSMYQKEKVDEPFEYIHPLGILTLVLNHRDKELTMVSYTPTQNINCEQIKSIDWFFKDGCYTGHGTGQNG